MKLTINPETHLIEGVTRDPLTGPQFAALQPPDCPVCHAMVNMDRIDVTPDADYHARYGNCYIVGLWTCPHGCDPRTGERMHYGQTYETSKSRIGTLARCSCGDETVISSQLEYDGWIAVHHPKGL